MGYLIDACVLIDHLARRLSLRCQGGQVHWPLVRVTGLNQDMVF